MTIREFINEALKSGTTMDELMAAIASEANKIEKENSKHTQYMIELTELIRKIIYDCYPDSKELADELKTEDTEQLFNEMMKLTKELVKFDPITKFLKDMGL